MTESFQYPAEGKGVDYDPQISKKINAGITKDHMVQIVPKIISGTIITGSRTVDEVLTGRIRVGKNRKSELVYYLIETKEHLEEFVGYDLVEFIQEILPTLRQQALEALK